MIKILLFIILSISVFADGHILIYHRVGDNRHKSTSISTSKFNEHMKFLKENNYKVVPLSKITDNIEKNIEIPDNWVSITIDDGFKSFYKNGLPILKRYNYPFTVFVNTQPTDGHYGDFMTWDMIKDTLKYGDIQAHSYSHPHFPKLTSKEAYKDIKRGSDRLKKALSKDINSFAYPYGEYDNQTIKVLKDNQFKFAFKQVMGAVSSKSDHYMINRIPVGENGSIRSLLKLKYLDAKWVKVDYTKEALIGFKVKLPKDVKKIEVFLSGHNWTWMDVKGGYIKFNKKFTRKRNTLLIKDSHNSISDYQILL